jgi:hypothetical protein
MKKRHKNTNFDFLQPTEKEIQNSIISYLNIAGHYVWRQNSGFFKHNYRTKSGIYKTSVIRSGVKGISDIIGIAKDGRMIAIEVKRKGNKPDVHQLAFLDEIRSRGGYAIVAYSLEDVEKAFS